MKRHWLLPLAVLIVMAGFLTTQQRKLVVKKSITVTSPKANAIYRENNTLQVTWKSEGITGTLKATIIKSNLPHGTGGSNGLQLLSVNSLYRLLFDIA